MEELGQQQVKPESRRWPAGFCPACGAGMRQVDRTHGLMAQRFACVNQACSERTIWLKADVAEGVHFLAKERRP